MHPSIFSSIHPSIPPLKPSSIHASIRPTTHPPVQSRPSRFIHLLIHLLIHSSPTQPSMQHPSSHFGSTHPPTRPSVHPSIYLKRLLGTSRALYLQSAPARGTAALRHPVVLLPLPSPFLNCLIEWQSWQAGIWLPWPPAAWHGSNAVIRIGTHR